MDRPTASRTGLRGAGLPAGHGPPACELGPRIAKPSRDFPPTKWSTGLKLADEQESGDSQWVLGIVLAAVLAALLLAENSGWVPYVPRASVRPPVIVRLPGASTQVRMFPGVGGVFFVMPDGSLWRWGHTDGLTSSRAVTPQPVGTDHDWLQAVAANGHCVALRTDGSFWTWGHDYAAMRQLLPAPPALASNPPPKRVGAAKDWVSVAAGDLHSIALKQDGTVWAWGYSADGEMGNGLGPAATGKMRLASYWADPVQTNLVQVGTNRDWRAISAPQGLHTLGLRADGTLWMWGRIHAFPNGQPGAVFPVPTQVCRETNWVSLAGNLALNNRGELWLTLSGPPNAAAPAAEMCRLFATNCQPDRFAVARGVYRIRADGTLWKKQLSFSKFTANDPWRQVGKRTDWKALCGLGTALGLTADGTVWTWGADLGQEGVMPWSVRARMMEHRIAGWFGRAAANTSVYWVTPVQREPRPLLKLLTEPVPTGTSNRSPNQRAAEK